MEHDIVNKYSDMIAEEVNRYRNEMLEYFHAREINRANEDDHSALSSNSNRQLYTTSVARTTYEIEGYISDESDAAQKVGAGVEDDTSAGRSSTDARTRLRSMSYDPDQPQSQTFITEDTASIVDIDTIPFYKSFKIPSNLVQSIMFK
jgi:hypothetical protein